MYSSMSMMLFFLNFCHKNHGAKIRSKLETLFTRKKLYTPDLKSLKENKSHNKLWRFLKEKK